MVSFSCESCGDVLTKKKLDPHRNQCRGATFTCLDCMVHFHGTDYRSHTSCMTEAQKYEGALYKDKKASKHSRQNSKSDSQALVPRTAYVEDATEEDNRVALVDAPPHAPSPPPTVNVFDFLVAEATPNASRAALPNLDEPAMLEDAKDRNEPSTDLVRTNGRHYHDASPYDSQEHFATNGFSYGSAPIQPSFERYESYQNYRDDNDIDPPLDSYYATPGSHKYEVRTPRDTEDAANPPTSAANGTTTTTTTTNGRSHSKKTERKRKRNHVEDLDMALVRAQTERDAVMTDAPPLLQHSGLTGGLNRMLTRPEFPPSPDYSGGDWVDASPISPMKRSKQVHRERERERERGRDREPKPRRTSGGAVIVTAPSATRGSGAWVRHRRDRDESAREHRRHRSAREQQQHRSRRRRDDYSLSGSEAEEREREERDREWEREREVRVRKPALKAIEYKPQRSASVEARDDNALVRQEQAVVRRGESGVGGSGVVVSNVMQARAEMFMSMVTKGPDSERGFSVNKALKRYHRQRSDNWDRGASWGGMSKAEEEKELWKSLRLKRNDRGEIVVFMDC